MEPLNREYTFGREETVDELRNVSRIDVYISFTFNLFALNIYVCSRTTYAVHVLVCVREYVSVCVCVCACMYIVYTLMKEMLIFDSILKSDLPSVRCHLLSLENDDDASGTEIPDIPKDRV